VGPLEEGKHFGKMFSFFKRGENIVKGEGNLGEGEIWMSFVLLSVMILKLEIFFIFLFFFPCWQQCYLPLIINEPTDEALLPFCCQNTYNNIVGKVFVIINVV
jgi:hypothetical protein